MGFFPLVCCVMIVVPIVDGLTVAMFAVVDNWIRITACLEELPHFLCFLREVSVIATNTPQSKELRVGDGVLDVCWVG